MLKCRACGKPLSKNRLKVRAVFCDRKCRWEWTTKQRKRMDLAPGIATATVGSISELAVAIDLMKKGQHVFRAVSPACPCDLIVIEEDGKLARIEVRTGRIGVSGKLQYATARFRADIMAVVTESRIFYLKDGVETFIHNDSRL